MAEFSFLTKYIFGTGIEEIDINSWKDIEVQYSDGRCEKMEEHFESPEHAINVIRRMLHVSGMVLDNASPAVLGHLSKNIRIAVLKTPLVDEDVGIAASIRIVNPQSLKKSDFVDGGTATDEMLDSVSVWQVPPAPAKQLWQGGSLLPFPITSVSLPLRTEAGSWLLLGRRMER